MTDREYNGWTNWETWSVSLYIGEGLIDEESIRDAVKEHESDPYSLGQWAREIVEEYALEGLDSAGLASHFVVGCLGSADWYSIGRHFVENFEEVEESGS